MLVVDVSVGVVGWELFGAVGDLGFVFAVMGLVWEGGFFGEGTEVGEQWLRTRGGEAWGDDGGY